MHKLILIPVIALIAFLATQDAALRYWRSQEGTHAPWFLAKDPALRVRRTDDQIGTPQVALAHVAQVSEDARALLSREPLDTVALRQIGMVTGLRQAGAAHAQLLVAERISRRDIANELLLIESASRAGEVKATLAHYDRALMVHSEASKLLFPVLAHALAEGEVRNNLVAYARRPWFAGFLSSASTQGADINSVRTLLIQARRHMPSAIAETVSTDLLSQLLASGNYTAARDWVDTLPGEFATASQDIGFASRTINPRLGRLAWKLANDNAIDTALVGRNGLSIRVASERSGTVAERVTLLTSGTYAFIQSVTYEASAPHARLTWNVRCLDGKAAVSILEGSPPLLEGKASYQTQLTIPEGCAAQAWRLNAAADMAQIASTASISGLSLNRL